ncbi:polyubiquitin-like [Megalops cyprinoides]|uniref:polyubiquitin-like n=1 Tax=Megalops cyprinoides TaxID=118141 RepID=UPI001864177D|nr:polyubiquitin-like [Megalops cyprinoides]
MDLTITFLNGQSFSLFVQLHTTVGELKNEIQARAQVPRGKQRLTAQNGQRIDLTDDAKTLQGYGLRSGTMVMVLITEPASIQVFLKNDKNQTHTYDVSPDETVSEFKRKVYNKENVPVDQQRLTYGSRQLEDGRKLEDYGIKAGSTIHLLLRLRGGRF